MYQLIDNSMCLLFEYLKCQAIYYLSIFAIVAVALLCGHVALFLSGFIVESFGMNDSRMYLTAVLFLVIITVPGWVWDKYNEW